MPGSTSRLPRWERLTSLATQPPARGYHTFTTYGVMGGGLLFGGRSSVTTNQNTALGDTWLFAAGKWSELPSTKPDPNTLQSESAPAPSKRWGHAVACGLNASVPDEVAENLAKPGAAGSGKRFGFDTFVGPADCMLFGGAVFADGDFFSDTWLLYRNGGQPVWKQQNDWPPPRGRWCHMQATCPDPADGVVMVGGSSDVI